MIFILAIFCIFMTICMMLILAEPRGDKLRSGSIVDASYWGHYKGVPTRDGLCMMPVPVCENVDAEQQFGHKSVHPTI